jgi:hypothetical protein
LEREAEKTNDPPNSAGPIQQVSHQVEWFDQQTTVAERQPDSEALDQPIELDDSTRNQFATRVQPILMNRCSGCHAREKREHQFQLHSSLTSRWAPKRVVEDNLRAVMPYLDLDQPMSSELRRRALDNHGGRQNSFGDEQSAMTAHLDMWLQSLRGGKSRAFSASKKKSLGRGPAPHTPRIAETLEPSPPPRLNPFGERLSQPDGADAAWSEVSLRENAARTKPTARSSDRGTPRRMPPVRNPFDPEIFNRQFQNR